MKQVGNHYVVGESGYSVVDVLLGAFLFRVVVAAIEGGFPDPVENKLAFTKTDLSSSLDVLFFWLRLLDLNFIPPTFGW